MKYCFGIDIGGTTVKLGLFDENGELLSKWQIITRTENRGEAILPDIVNAIRIKQEEYDIAIEEIIGVGVGVPAAVCGNGIVETTTNLGWGYKNVKQELEDLTGLSVFVENDANVAALGEMYYGAGIGCKNVVMLTLGTGVGGGIVANGKLVAGVKGGAQVDVLVEHTVGAGGEGFAGARNPHQGLVLQSVLQPLLQACHRLRLVPHHLVFRY